MPNPKKDITTRKTPSSVKVTRATSSVLAIKDTRARDLKVEAERTQFRKLIAVNPNYYGNIKKSPYKEKKLIANNVYFEELKCVGFNPDTQYLEAVVHIKQESGYGGDICSAGTKEYVRFFLSYDNGATWVDQGITNFTAYDVPGPKPLEYSVRLLIDPEKFYCTHENLPKVRAILSWNYPPPEDDANFTPVWGNHLDNTIQIGAFKTLKIKDFLNIAKFKVTPDIADIVDLEQLIKPKPPKKPGPFELAPTYLKNKVPAHRLLFKEISSAIKQPDAIAALQLPGIEGIMKAYQIDLPNIIQAYLNTDGNTAWEELNCVGMCQSTFDWLTATFRIKQHCGYCGGLCDDGGYEYIAFWVDWGDGAGWTYAGTGSVNVHDLSSLPAGGIEYSVSIPVNTLSYRQPCNDGPKTARVRAILSWYDAPPPGNPDYIPIFGNREETLVLLQPGLEIPAEDKQKMLVDSVGNMAVCDIDQTTGLANGGGQIAAFTASQSPFGGTVRITGYIIEPPNAMADPTQAFKYRVSVRRLTGVGAPTSWQPLANDFDITITEQDGIEMPHSYHHNQQIDADGFYTYWEQIYNNQWRQVTMDKIASWETRGLAAELWEIKVEVKLPDGTILPSVEILCDADGTTRSTVKVRLDEGAPNADIEITGYTDATGPHTDIVECGTFTKGVTITGTYTISDPESNWGYKYFSVLPSGPAVVSIPTTTGIAGESGTWSLNTSTMAPCGYVVYLWTRDQTIVDSGSIGWWKSDSDGFCLKA